MLPAQESRRRLSIPNAGNIADLHDFESKHAKDSVTEITRLIVGIDIRTDFAIQSPAPGLSVLSPIVRFTAGCFKAFRGIPRHKIGSNRG